MRPHKVFVRVTLFEQPTFYLRMPKTLEHYCALECRLFHSSCGRFWGRNEAAGCERVRISQASELTVSVCRPWAGDLSRQVFVRTAERG